MVHEPVKVMVHHLPVTHEAQSVDLSANTLLARTATRTTIVVDTVATTDAMMIGGGTTTVWIDLEMIDTAMNAPEMIGIAKNTRGSTRGSTREIIQAIGMDEHGMTTARPTGPNTGPIGIRTIHAATRVLRPRDAR